MGACTLHRCSTPSSRTPAHFMTASSHAIAAIDPSTHGEAFWHSLDLRRNAQYPDQRLFRGRQWRLARLLLKAGILLLGKSTHNVTSVLSAEDRRSLIETRVTFEWTPKTCILERAGETVIPRVWRHTDGRTKCNTLA
jgi:hypothetical protein